MDVCVCLMFCIGRGEDLNSACPHRIKKIVEASKTRQDNIHHDLHDNLPNMKLICHVDYVSTYRPYHTMCYLKWLAQSVGTEAVATTQIHSRWSNVTVWSVNESCCVIRVHMRKISQRSNYWYMQCFSKRVKYLHHQSDPLLKLAVKVKATILFCTCTSVLFHRWMICVLCSYLALWVLEYKITCPNQYLIQTIIFIEATRKYLLSTLFHNITTDMRLE